MTHEYYQQEARRLREVMKDAEGRGDYHREMDVKEALQKLRDAFNSDNE